MGKYFRRPSMILLTDIMDQIQVDLGGSLAVASQGLFSTGVSTDLNGITATELKLQ